jgi:hypothetical protein
MAAAARTMSHPVARAVSIVLAAIVLLAALPVAVLLWRILPAGGPYPVLFVGLPSLPFLWIGFTLLKWGGLPIDYFIRRRPWLVGLIVALWAALAYVVATWLDLIPDWIA